MKHFSSSAQGGSDLGRKSSVAGKSAVAAQIGISRQNLYYQPRLPAKDLELKNKIEAVGLEHKTYGYRRIAIDLGVNHKRVHRVMKLFGLKARRSLNRRPKVRDNRDLSKAGRHQNLFVKEKRYQVTFYFRKLDLRQALSVGVSGFDTFIVSGFDTFIWTAPTPSHQSL